MSSAITIAPLRDVLRASLPALTNMFSPTKNPCVVKVTPMKGAKRFRYDPYKAHVLTPSVFSPEKPRTPVAFTAPAAIAAAVPAMTTVAAATSTFFSTYAVPYAAAAHYHPHHPVAPFVLSAPHSYGAPSQASSCEATPVPSVAPSRTVTPIPAIAHTAPTERSSSCTSNSSTTASSSWVDAMHYAVVQFKHDTYPYLAPFRVSVGDQVIVNGDRGENLGVVRSITTTKPSRPVASRILRVASDKDRETSAMLRRKEDAATKFCDSAVKEFGIDMTIVDTEYQLDQAKLSIYFKSKGMVDFRRLQRVLFREFRCRVWLVNWNELVFDE